MLDQLKRSSTSAQLWWPLNMRRSARTPKKLAAYDPDEEASKPQFASSKTPKKSAPKKATLKAPKSPSPSPKAKSRSPSPKAASPAVAHYKPARASPSPPPAGAASRQLDPDSDSFLTLQAVIMVCAAAAFIEYQYGWEAVSSAIFTRLESLYKSIEG